MQLGLTKLGNNNIRISYPISNVYVSPFFLNTNGSFFLIPIDPYFFTGFPLNLVRQFASVKITSCHLRVSPEVGTNTNNCTMYWGVFPPGVAFCSSENINTYYADCLATGVGSLFTAWQPQRIELPKSVCGEVMAIKGSMDDLRPYLVICSPSLALKVDSFLTPIITMDVELGPPVNVVDLGTNVAPVGFSLSPLGVLRSDTTFSKNCYGYLTGVGDSGFLDEGNAVFLPNTSFQNSEDIQCIPHCNGITLNINRFSGAPNSMLAAFEV